MCTTSRQVSYMQRLNGHRRGAVRRQRGIAAIEFALVFPMFFAVIYAVITYGLVFMFQQGLTMAAQEGARAAVSADPTDPAQDVRIWAAVNAANAIAWFPPDARQHVLSNIAAGIDFNALGQPQVTVTVAYPAYPDNSLLPLLWLPGIGNFPPVPQNLIGQAVLRLD